MALTARSCASPRWTYLCRKVLMSPSSASDHCYVSNCSYLHSHEYIKLILARISLHGKSFMLKDATRIARLTRTVTITTRIVTRRQRGTRLFVGTNSATAMWLILLCPTCYNAASSGEKIQSRLRSLFTMSARGLYCEYIHIPMVYLSRRTTSRYSR